MQTFTFLSMKRHGRVVLSTRIYTQNKASHAQSKYHATCTNSIYKNYKISHNIPLPEKLAKQTTSDYLVQLSFVSSMDKPKKHQNIILHITNLITIKYKY